MKIIDSHCHAWALWPYSAAVPDPESRGIVEQLLYEMDVNGVDEAAIVSAEIKGNPENNAYIAAQVARHPERLHQFVDIASMWSPTYHQPGAGDRLQEAAEKWTIIGFTHYVDARDDGSWLRSDEGAKLFQTAADLNLIASIHCQVSFQPISAFWRNAFHLCRFSAITWGMSPPLDLRAMPGCGICWHRQITRTSTSNCPGSIMRVRRKNGISRILTRTASSKPNMSILGGGCAGGRIIR